LRDDAAGGPVSPDTHESLYTTQRGNETASRVTSSCVCWAATLVPLKRGPSTWGGGAMFGLPNILFVAEVDAAVLAIESTLEGIAEAPSAKKRQMSEEIWPIIVVIRVCRRSECQ
jgi:hypothetical protein